MAYLQVYFNGVLKSEFKLKPGVTTIGRSPENDVTISNVGVSGHHAKIVRHGERFVVEDTNSTNGIFVNGKRTKRHELAYGDEIAIFKHTLKFKAVGALQESVGSMSADTQGFTQGSTVEVDVSQLGDLLRERQKVTAYLEIRGEAAGLRKFPLHKVNFSIGKSKDADLQTGGWFAPKHAAKITRQSDGYYIVPEKRGRVRLNGTAVRGPAKIRDGDALWIRGLEFTFFHRPAPV